MIEITETDALSRVAAYCSTAEHCRAEVTEKLQRLSYLYLPPFGKAVLIMNEGTAKAFLINIFLLFQTVDYAVYGIIGNTPTLHWWRMR